MKRILIFVVMFILSGQVRAQGSVLQIEGATIRGNQELPTVLYLVPWQAPKVYSLDKPKQNIAATQPLDSLERSRFLRVVRYYDMFEKSKLSGEPSLQIETTK